MHRALATAALLLAACSLERSGFGAGRTDDGGAFDAEVATADAGAVLDATPATPMDAGSDAGTDAGSPDAGCPDELCNAADDDCDGEVDEGSTCGCERIVRDDHLYLACLDVRASFDEAHTWCRDRGYDMAVLADESEHDEVLAWIDTGELWIGLTDRDSERTFVWIDGTELEYERWEGFEPNDLFGEDCTFVYGDRDKWNDAECDDDHAVLCELELPPSDDSTGSGAR